MWLCIPIPVRHQLINMIKVVLLSIRNQYHIKENINCSDIIIFLGILLNEASDVAIFILSHI